MHSIFHYFGHRKYASAQNLFHHVGYAVGIIQHEDISFRQIYRVAVGVGNAPRTEQLIIGRCGQNEGIEYNNLFVGGCGETFFQFLDGS